MFIGTQLAWSWLRFRAPHDTDAVVGDPADHFAWATCVFFLLLFFYSKNHNVCVAIWM